MDDWNIQVLLGMMDSIAEFCTDYTLEDAFNEQTDHWRLSDSEKNEIMSLIKDLPEYKALQEKYKDRLTKNHKEKNGI